MRPSGPRAILATHRSVRRGCGREVLPRGLNLMASRWRLDGVIAARPEVEVHAATDTDLVLVLVDYGDLHHRPLT